MKNDRMVQDGKAQRELSGAEQKKAPGQERQDPFGEERIRQLDRLAQRLENSGVAEYVKLSQKTWKILWLNFLSGIARGLGFTVGTAIVLAVTYKIISRLISMNIPYLTEILRELIVMVKAP